MRLAAFAATLLFATCAAAQPGPDGGPGAYPPADQAPQAAPMPPPNHRGGPMFDAANTTRDGRLTRDQAQAGGMRHIAQHFDEIDADRKGYVTKQDIKAWRQAKRAAKQARLQPPEGQPGAYPPAGGPPAPQGEQPGPPPQ